MVVVTFSGRPGSAFGKITVHESSGRKTTISKVSNIDLFVQQTTPDGKKARMISPNNDPGIKFYASLLLFLYQHNLKVPPIGRHDAQSTPVLEKAVKAAEQISAGDYPVNYSIQFSYENKKITIEPMYEIGRQPWLEVHFEGQKMVLPISVIQALVKNIPKLYPYSGFAFEKMNEIFKKAANQGKIKRSGVVFERKQKPKQLEFGFMKEIKREAALRRRIMRRRRKP